MTRCHNSESRRSPENWYTELQGWSHVLFITFLCNSHSWAKIIKDFYEIFYLKVQFIVREFNTHVKLSSSSILE